MFKEFKRAFLETISPKSTDTAPPKPALEASILFKNLTPEQCAILKNYFKTLWIEAGKTIIQEGESSQSLYIIEKGSVETFKQSPLSKVEYPFHTFQTGDCFGEMSLLDQQVRSASIRTLEPTELSVLDKETFLALKKSHHDIYDIVSENLSKEIASRLRFTNQTTVKALEEALVQSKERASLAILTSYIIFLVSLYSLSLGVLSRLVKHVELLVYLTIPLVSIFAAAVVGMMVQSKIPLKAFGFNLDNWRRGLVEAVGLSVILMAASIGIKWTIIEHFMTANPPPLFNVQFTYTVFLYIFSVLFQEVIIRGGIQSPLMYFVPQTRYRSVIIVGITTLMFSAVHGHASLLFVITAFIPGVLWSLLYLRQKSLLGVCVCHLLVGVWALYILGIEDIVLKF